MKVVNTLRRIEGESEEHYRARQIIFNFLIKSFSNHNLQLWTEYPPEGRRRGDLVVDYFKPPFYRVKKWIEVQETPLPLDVWKKRIYDIINSYNPEELWIVLTQSSRKEIKKLKKVQQLLGFNFIILIVDTSTGKILFNV